MRALIQRVTRASVSVDGTDVGTIGVGLAVMLGVGRDDEDEDSRYLVERISNLRIFPDEQNRFNRSALDIGAELLIISQFTLYAGTRKGRRPDFTQAAAPDEAEQLYERTVERLRETGLKVEMGRFGEHMLVDLQNDGPVTIMLDSADRFRPRRS